MPKMTLKFDDRINTILTVLAERKATTKVDIIRRALAAYKYLDDELQDSDRRVSITSVKEDIIIKDVILP